ncbi:MAG: alpha/beta hydrolase family protein [Candidatus Binatia bacterium]
MRCAVVLLVLLLAFSMAHAAADPAEPGRFAVGVTTVEVDDASRHRTLTTEIWYPARRAGRDAAPRRGSWPLILVAHGLCGFRTNYEYVATHLVSRGFVVAAPDFPGFNKTVCDTGAPTDFVDGPPLDLSFVCRTLHDRTGPLGRFARHVRGVATGLVGHSLGGLAVVNATLIDPAFTAIVPLAPAVSGTGAEPFTELDPRRAVLVMGGGADRTISFDAWTRPFFEGLPAPAYLVRIAAGTHSGFTDMDAGLSAEALAAQQSLVDRYTAAFFDRYLHGRRRAARWLRDADDGTVLVTGKTR